MARILRGDVVWVDLNPVRGHEQGGRRPVVVVSEDVFNARSGTVIAMAITGQSQAAGFPLTLEITSVKLPKRSWVKVSQIRTLSVDRIGSKIGRISPDELDRIIEGLNEIVGGT
jgi:mRNA interferase MazF